MKNLMTNTFLSLLLLTGLFSCKKYLDARPDKQQVVPASLQDLQALLDNVLFMNRSFPSSGEASTDDYFITLPVYNSLPLAQDKTIYTWQPDGTVVDGQWLAPYRTVFYANQALESLGQLSADPVSSGQVEGAALFFRAYAFLELAGLFAAPYNDASAATDLGIPLRLTADFNQQTTRASNRDTYARIITDFKNAAALLPVNSAYPSRPTKVAAYGALARVSLAMGKYTDAAAWADSCLSYQPSLMDFNTLNAASANPIPRFNQETIFYAMSSGTSLLVPSKYRIDSILYRSFAVNDLRRTVYFKSNGDGTYSFKGNYDGVQSSVIFSGLATDEIYLIRAECYARAGQVAQAMAMLNTLLQTRFRRGTFQPYTAADSQTALNIILLERRKELVMRGLRWTDLRRLNQDPQQLVTLQRNLGGTSYQLPPNDLRYTLLIPQEVITTSGIMQNKR